MFLNYIFCDSCAMSSYLFKKHVLVWLKELINLKYLNKHIFLFSYVSNKFYLRICLILIESLRFYSKGIILRATKFSLS